MTEVVKMKKYIDPRCDIITIDISDIITNSKLDTEEAGYGGELDFNV